MTNKLSEFGEKAKNALERGFNHEQTQAALARVKSAGQLFGNEVARLGKEVVRSDMAKDAATGAAICALVAVPIPIIGPVGGAAVGALLGVFRNITKKGGSAQTGTQDIHGELTKLEELRQRGTITDAEFDEQKRKVLSQT